MNKVLQKMKFRHFKRFFVKLQHTRYRWTILDAQNPCNGQIIFSGPLVLGHTFEGIGKKSQSSALRFYSVGLKTAS